MTWAIVLAFFKHNIQRFIGVALIAVVVIGLPLGAYNYAHGKGYRAGYAQAVKDRPTYQITGGQNVLNQNTPTKEPWVLIKLFWLRISL